MSLVGLALRANLARLSPRAATHIYYPIPYYVPPLPSIQNSVILCLIPALEPITP